MTTKTKLKKRKLKTIQKPKLTREEKQIIYQSVHNKFREKAIELRDTGFPYKEIYMRAKISATKFSLFMHGKHRFSEKTLNRLDKTLKFLEEYKYVDTTAELEKIPRKFINKK